MARQRDFEVSFNPEHIITVSKEVSVLVSKSIVRLWFQANIFLDYHKMRHSLENGIKTFVFSGSRISCIEQVNGWVISDEKKLNLYIVDNCEY